MDKVLNIFDMDETLFDSGCKTKVMKDGKVEKTLSAQDLFTYKLGSGESYDFGEFRSSQTFYSNARPLQPFFDYAVSIVANQHHDSRSIIITARDNLDDRDLFLEKFRVHGFPIDKVYVERAGNLGQYTTKFRSQIYKGAVIKKYINMNKYNVIKMWDDSDKNLDMLNKLGVRHGIATETYKVNPFTGTFTRHSNAFTPPPEPRTRGKAPQDSNKRAGLQPEEPSPAWTI